MSILLYAGKYDDAATLEPAMAFRGEPDKAKRFKLTVTNVFVDDLLDLAGGDEHVHVGVRMGDESLAARSDQQTARTRYTYYSEEPIESKPVHVPGGQSILEFGVRVAQIRDEAAFIKQFKKGCATVDDLLVKADELGIRGILEKVSGVNPGTSVESLLPLLFKDVPYAEIIAKVLLVASSWVLETIYKDDVRIDLSFAFDLTGKSASAVRFRTGYYVAAFWPDLTLRDKGDLETHPEVWGLSDGRLVGPHARARTDYVTFAIESV